MLTTMLVTATGLVIVALIIRSGRRTDDDPVPAGAECVDRDLPVAAFWTTAEGRLIRGNDRCRKLLGTESSGQGAELSRFILEDDARGRWRTWLGSDDTSLQMRADVRTAAGDVAEMVLIAERRHDPDRVVGVLLEGAERLDGREESDGEARFFRDVLASAPMGIATFDRNGRVGTVWNPAAQSILGWTAEEVEGRLLPLLPSPLDVDTGGRGAARVVRRWHRDGHPMELSIAAAEVSDGSGELVAVIEDVTERVRREEEHRRLGEIVRSTPDLVLILDVRGRVMYRNPAARARLGEPPAGEGDAVLAEWLGRPWAGRWRQEIVPMVTAGSSWTGELRFGPAPGFVASIVVTGHRSHDGTLSHLSVLVRDISEQRSMEEQLRQAQKLEAVGQLTGGIAHDFNNLLTVVHANAELLSEGAAGGERDDLLDDIRKAAGRGRDLVRRLMVFSRKETLEPRPYRLDEIEGYIQTLRRLLPESITVAWRCTAEEPVASADPGALQQILLNLATNARDAMPDGGSLEIVVADAASGVDAATGAGVASGSGRLEISVADTGTGISPPELERIFEPFYTTKDPGKGTGLGLAMVYGLVGEMGGEIRVDSEPGEGTTFRLLFDRTAPSDEGGVEDVATPEVAGGEGQEVLIVEDEEAIRHVTRRMLERLGYQVVTAADGREGLEVLLSRPGEVDLVLSDVVMPRMGGHELLRAIRTAGSQVPVIFMSGYTEEEIREETDGDARVFVLAKPWTRDDLHAAVAGVLGRTHGTDARPVP